MTDFILILILNFGAQNATMTATPGYVQEELCKQAAKEWLKKTKELNPRNAFAFCITGPNS